MIVTLRENGLKQTKRSFRLFRRTKYVQPLIQLSKVYCKEKITLLQKKKKKKLMDSNLIIGITSLPILSV